VKQGHLKAIGAIQPILEIGNHLAHPVAAIQLKAEPSELGPEMLEIIR